MRAAFILALLLPTDGFANLGHRGGSDFHKHMPENSLAVLEESITGAETGSAIQNNKDFDTGFDLSSVIVESCQVTNRKPTAEDLYHD